MDVRHVEQDLQGDERIQPPPPVRKRSRTVIVDYLPDTALEELYAIKSYPDLSDDDKYFYGAVVNSQFVTGILATENVLCPKQDSHIQPMVGAHVAAVEEKAGK